MEKKKRTRTRDSHELSGSEMKKIGVKPASTQVDEGAACDIRKPEDCD